MPRIGYMLLLAAVVLASSVRAEVWYVAADGSDQNGGTTPESPFLTLSAALDSCEDGDTVAVAEGVYSGAKNVGLSLSNSVSIEGKSEASTVFHATDEVEAIFVLAGDVEASLTRLTLAGPTALTPSTSIVGIDSAAVGAALSITSVTFEDLSRGVVLGFNSGAASAVNCSFSNRLQYGIYFRPSTASNLVTIPSIVASGCKFDGNFGVHVDLYSDPENSSFEAILLTDCDFTDSGVYITGRSGPASVSVLGSSFTDKTGDGHTSIRIAGDFPSITIADVSVSGSTASAPLNIDNWSPTVDSYTTISNSTFSFNEAGYTVVETAGTNVEITNCEFVGNQGHALQIFAHQWADLPVTASVTNCTFADNNSAADPFHTLYLEHLESATIANCSFVRNQARGGGALYTLMTDVLVRDSFFYENKAHEGGAISAMQASNMVVRNCSISGNSASSRGGGIHLSGSLSLEASTVSGNTAPEGGGVYSGWSSVFNSLLSTVSGNTAESGGGWYSDGIATAQETVVEDNSASIAGGGFACSGQDADISLVDCVFDSNTAPIGSAYSCSSGCTTSTTNVHLEPNNEASCGSSR